MKEYDFSKGVRGKYAIGKPVDQSIMEKMKKSPEYRKWFKHYSRIMLEFISKLNGPQRKMAKKAWKELASGLAPIGRTKRAM